MNQFHELLAEWLRRTGRVQLAQYETATRMKQLHYWLGIPTVILGGLVTTSIFATLEADTSVLAIRVVTGLISALSGILAALSTFFRFGERAEQHRMAGARYSNLKREIEQKLMTVDDVTSSYVDDLRLRWDKLNEECPTVPRVVWRLYRPDGEARLMNIFNFSQPTRDETL